MIALKIKQNQLCDGPQGISINLSHNHFKERETETESVKNGFNPFYLMHF